MKKIINTIERELGERDRKYRNTVSYKDAVIITIFWGITLLVVTGDTQIYFYKNFLFYSAVFFVFLCAVLCFVIPKIFKINLLYLFSALVLNVTLSLWIVPKITHYIIIPSQATCYNGTLDDKRWIRPENKGRIKIYTETNSSIFSQDNFSNTWITIPEYEYNQLQPIGSKIQICGQLSKVGFSYEYIDTVK